MVSADSIAADRASLSAAEAPAPGAGCSSLAPASFLAFSSASNLASSMLAAAALASRISRTVLLKALEIWDDMLSPLRVTPSLDPVSSDTSISSGLLLLLCRADRRLEK